MFFPFWDESELRCGNPPSCSEKIRSPGVADTNAFHQFKTDTGINTDKKNMRLKKHCCVKEMLILKMKYRKKVGHFLGCRYWFLAAAIVR